MKREPITTKIEDIVKYWYSRIDESNISVDATEANTHCWRCGCEKNLERCHIVPDSLGGKDEASNLVLLCSRCHAENQNVADSEIMWDWLKAYKVPLYDTFWGIRGIQEYKFVYKRSVYEELNNIIKDLDKENREDIEKDFKKIIKKVSEEASIHFGQPYYNNATIAGMYRVALKQYAEKVNKSLHSLDNPSVCKHWWLDQ